MSRMQPVDPRKHGSSYPLQRVFNDMPVPSRQPPSTDTPLLESIRADIDYDDLSDEDTATADSPMCRMVNKLL